MDVLDRLESAVEALLEKNRHLRAEVDTLRSAKEEWQGEREYLIGEIDRILERLETISEEDK